MLPTTAKGVERASGISLIVSVAKSALRFCSQQAMEYSRDFITSVVVGKDVVPRIGLHQLEALRHDLILALHTSKEAKWRTLAGTCFGSREPTSAAVAAAVAATADVSPAENKEVADGGNKSRADVNVNPVDSSLHLCGHQPLFPPGRIVHLVREYPSASSGTPT